MNRNPELTEVQKEVVQVAHEHGGVLERWPGGFWTYPGVLSQLKGQQPIPAWWCGTNTVLALLRRGDFELVESQWNRPSKVKLRA